MRENDSSKAKSKSTSYTSLSRGAASVSLYAENKDVKTRSGVRIDTNSEQESVQAGVWRGTIPEQKSVQAGLLRSTFLEQKFVQAGVL